MTTPVHIDPFAPARWELVRDRTALIVIDPQNDFLHEGGWYAQQGIDISHMRRLRFVMQDGHIVRHDPA